MATGLKKFRDPSERVARRLLAEGRIARDVHDAALRHRTVKGIRFEEGVIEAGVPEEQLLRILAEMYRVQYISSSKLAAAAIDRRTLALVPVQVAEQRQVVPVLLDRQRSVLSVVTTDPDDAETLKELEIATQVRTIRPLVARPAAVEAAVRKFYLGDDVAFNLLRNSNFDVAAGLLREPMPAVQMPRGETVLSERGIVMPRKDSEEDDFSMSATSFNPPAPRPSGQYPAPRLTPHSVPAVTARSLAPPLPRRPTPTSAAHISHPSLSFREARRGALTPPPPPSAEPTYAAESARHLTPPPALPIEEPSRAEPSRVEPAAAPPRSGPVPTHKSRTRVERPTPMVPEASRATPDSEVVGDPFNLAVVMVSLLEGNRPDLRGHSVQTARLVNTVCGRFDLSLARTRAAEVAALIHDFGKASSYHLTPYNVARFEGHRAAAEKLHSTPTRVVELAKLDSRVVNAVEHMYERYDAQGFPGALRGQDIPLESRILAICDSYTDLTSNPRNSFRKVLSAPEACDALRELQGTIFDPQVFDRFVHVVLGDEIAQKLRGDRGTLLLVDPDVEETTVLELALLEKRYAVHVVRALDEATHLLASVDVDIVVSEMALDQGTGSELLSWVKARNESTPFVFLSEETDATTVAEALDAGASDYLFKPLATPVVLAKLRRILDQSQSARRVRGVSGSLEEMAIPDLVQILHQGRKTGALQISADGDTGAVFFKDGAIMNAHFRSLSGEEAFFAIVGIAKGEFTIDPGVAPPERVIQASPEMLLLEGMRRLDEGSR